jgi:hypothetical protein
MASLPSFIKQVKEMGLETGVIYDARAKSASGEEAVSQIVSEYRQLEDMLGVSVDKAVFGGWYRYPDHLLPEGDPSALVNALTGYILPKPTASLHVGTHCLDGTVTMHGDPLRGAGVSLQRLQGLAPEMLYTSTIDGKVPAWATRALFGVRINDESSPEEWADLKLTLGAFRYKEKSPFAKSVVQVAASELAKWQKWRSREGLFSLEQDSRSGRVSITIQQDASYSFNGPFFDVDPGAHYEASLMESLQPRAVGAAYAIVVFFSEDFTQSQRQTLRFGYKYSTNARTVTNDLGQFKFLHTDGRYGPYNELLVERSTSNRGRRITPGPGLDFVKNDTHCSAGRPRQ